MISLISKIEELQSWQQEPKEISKIFQIITSQAKSIIEMKTRELYMIFMGPIMQIDITIMSITIIMGTIDHLLEIKSICTRNIIIIEMVFDYLSCINDFGFRYIYK